ncbi:MAG: hypothetical protein IT536_12360 [Hyphomicrobiales bacterium]|nr:hypothetical protein [Hyphomicrobiales bacterium]
MTEPPAQPHHARIIPLRLIDARCAINPGDAGVLFRTGTRTIRPAEVALLSPILIPVSAIVLLLLLAWFVLWLATVVFLIAAHLAGDATRALLARPGGAALRARERRAISFQGH